jgi:hypothetical protein
MTRNLKALGISLVAMLALSSAVAATASAIDEFVIPKAGVTLTGTGGPHMLQITGTSFNSECSHVEFTVEAKAVAFSELTTKPKTIKYKGKTSEPKSAECESALGDITFHSNECGYKLTGETVAKDGNSTDARVSLECPAGKAFTITAPLGCTIHVPAQTPTEGGVTYTNGTAGGKKDITVHATITGLTYSTTGIACAFAGIPAHGDTLDTNATYTITAPEGIEVK